MAASAAAILGMGSCVLEGSKALNMSKPLRRGGPAPECDVRRCPGLSC